MLFDYSKNIVTNETVALLETLAEERNLSGAIKDMFNGVPINVTEGRSVLHTALRNMGDEPVMVDGKNVVPEIREVREKVYTFAEKVRAGNARGYSNLPFTDVVNIGIGGSDLGCVMVCEALKSYACDINMHFLSNIDGTDFVNKVQGLNPETTLFIVASKSFTTQETLTKY